MNCYILLDRSGSMTSHWQEVINSLNAYVSELRENSKKKIKVTVCCFDTASFDIVRNKVKLKDWNDISTSEIEPRGMTPLYDAIGKLSLIVNKKKRKSADIIIMTDGAENNSKEYKKEDAKNIIEGFKKNGYALSFIGAEFDAFSSSSSVGISSANTLNMTKGNYSSVMKKRATKSMAYAITNDVNVMSFSDEDREEAVKKQES